MDLSSHEKADIGEKIETNETREERESWRWPRSDEYNRERTANKKR